MVVAVYYAYFLFSEAKRQDGWFWIFVAIAVAYNPFFPIYLGSKLTWSGIDLVVIIFFSIFTIKLGKNYKSLPEKN